MEQVLVDYMDVPIFFLCKEESQYYLALCVDIEELQYVVTKLSLLDVYDLLHGGISMRDSILKQKMYWWIRSGEDIYLDEVMEHEMKDLDDSLLPEEGAYFEILTEKMKKFIKKFDEKIFFDGYKIIENIIENREAFINIDGISKVFEGTMEEEWPAVSSYNEVMVNISGIQEKLLGNSKQLEEEIEDIFELKESTVYARAIAA